MSEEEEEVFDLPEDIVLKILCRLPVKSLIRFSCVSKRWRSIIICDPQFAKSHLQLASQQRTLRHRVLVSTISIVYKSSLYNDYNFTFIGNSQLQCLEDLAGDNFRVTNSTFPSEQQSKIVIASCNGLVILGSYYEDLSIWNPTTGFFRKIPDPKFSSTTKGTCRDASIRYGFGYVSATDDYKLVLVIPDDYSGPAVDVDVNIFIFSVRANSWSSSKGSHWSFPKNGWRRQHCGVLSNEAIHWVVNCYEYDVDGSLVVAFCIYAFDLASEELRLMPVPGCNQDDEENYRFVGKQMQIVVHLGGCLCLLSQSEQLFEENCDIGLWIMRDYGVSDSWMKVFEFRVDDLPHVFATRFSWHSDVSFITESGAIVIRLSEKELVRIECGKGEKPVCSSLYMLEDCPQRSFLLDTIVYDETLVSVPE